MNRYTFKQILSQNTRVITDLTGIRSQAWISSQVLFQLSYQVLVNQTSLNIRDAKYMWFLRNGLMMVFAGLYGRVDIIKLFFKKKNSGLVQMDTEEHAASGLFSSQLSQT